MSERQKSDSISAAVIGAVIGGIFTIAAAIIGLYGYNQSPQIEVLDVTGYSVSSAIQAITENQLQYKIENDIEFDANDIIIDQSIEPGTYVSKGTILTLTVHKGIADCEHHMGKEVASIDPIHPHYKWYICEKCNEKFTLEETSELSDCEICFPSLSYSNQEQPKDLDQILDESKPSGSGQNSSGDKVIDVGSASDDSYRDDSEGGSSEPQIEDLTQMPEPLPPEPMDFSVVVSYKVIPEYMQITDENMRITATTSHKATSVKLTVEPAAYDKEYSMHSINQIDWTFKACFDTAGTYTVTAVAYFEDGTTKSDSFLITYPFDY